MTPFYKFLLQADTLIIAAALIVYLFKFMNKGNQNSKALEGEAVKNELAADNINRTEKPQIKSGYSNGEVAVVGVDNDEVACAILAAVSTASSIPLNSLRIKSIKAIEE